MTGVGYADVRSQKMAVVLEFPSADAFGRYLIDVSPQVSALVGDQPSDRQEEYVQRLAEPVRRSATEDGVVRVRSTTICAVGRS